MDWHAPPETSIFFYLHTLWDDSSLLFLLAKFPINIALTYSISFRPTFVFLYTQGVRQVDIWVFSICFLKFDHSFKIFTRCSYI